MTIIMTAGNHNSASRHESYAEVMAELNIICVGQFIGGAKAQVADLIDDAVVTIGDKGYVLALPYVHTRNLPDNFYKKAVEEVLSRYNEKPVVGMGHLSVLKADVQGHSRAYELTVGDIDAINADSLGNGFDYMDLGHIHKPQTLITQKRRLWEKARKDYERWLPICEMLGDREGRRFTYVALSHVLAYLVEQANVYLDRIM